MYKVFYERCNEITDELCQNYSIGKIDALFWIYLNLYFYKIYNRYGKFLFLNYLKNNEHFHHIEYKYKNIPENEYSSVYNSVLKNYDSPYTNNNFLKEMEEVYERIIRSCLAGKSGTYYTPQSIVDYMVIKSLILYIKSKTSIKEGMLEEFFLSKSSSISIVDALEAAEVIDNIKIIDISCGGGVFLRSAFNNLFYLTKMLCQLTGKEINEMKIKKKILENNIYGVDIQEASVLLCKLLLLIESNLTNKGEKLEHVQLNLVQGDALVQDNVYGNDFDIVIGNPPYIGEKSNKTLFHQIKQSSFGKMYYESKMDYFYFFIYKAFEILKERGLLCFITTNYFVTADGAVKLRNFIKDNFNMKQIINFDELNIFKDAKGQHNMIFVAEKTLYRDSTVLINFNSDKIQINNMDKLLLEKNKCPSMNVFQLEEQRLLYDSKGYLMLHHCNNSLKILDKIESASNITLKELCEINQGIVSGADRLTIPWAVRLNKTNMAGRGIFVLNEQEILEGELNKEPYKKFFKKFYKNSHIKKYTLFDDTNLYILYINDENMSCIEEYPSIYNHLIQYKEVLQERREVKKGMRKWYALQWPRNNQIFEKEKIVVPQRGLENFFAYTKDSWHASADVYYITKKTEGISLIYLLGVLNSALMYYWLYYKGKRKGKYLELYATPLKAVPVYYPYDSGTISAMEKLVIEMLDNKENKEKTNRLQAQIDKMVFNIYQLTKREQEKIIRFKPDI